MRIKELILFTNKLDAQKDFFTKTLGLSIYEEENDNFCVQVGWTKFCFKYSDENYLYHYCFLIPGNKLQDALNWVESRVSLVETAENEKLVFFDTWNAHSFYFYDAAGNIAECIVRHDLLNHTDGPFYPMDFLCINEIGLGTANISKTNQQLENNLGSQLWKGDMERFATNGSQEGLFLLPNYQIKETWFPTDIVIKPNPLYGVIENEGKTYNFCFAQEELRKANGQTFFEHHLKQLKEQ